MRVLVHVCLWLEGPLELHSYQNVLPVCLQVLRTSIHPDNTSYYETTRPPRTIRPAVALKPTLVALQEQDLQLPPLVRRLATSYQRDLGGNSPRPQLA